MSRWRPGLGDFVPLDETTVRTEYLKAKGARLVLAHQATWLEVKSTLTEQWYAVRGDHGVYVVVVRTMLDPWQAACSRGGIHEAMPEDRACAHMVAAAVQYVRETPSLRAAIETAPAGEVAAHGE